MRLDVDSPIPLHIQIREYLRQEIAGGGYTERIPSEKELMELFSVSRTTVREAVSSLVREGVLEKIHGKGTFVADATINEWLGSIRSFTETVQNMGMKPGVLLLSHGLGHDFEIATILGADQYYTVERLRLADDIPIAIERHHYPVAIGQKLATYDLNVVTIYSVLEQDKVVLHTAEQRITAMPAAKADAQLLGIDENSCVLAVERTTYDPSGNVVEYYFSTFRADRYAFCVKLHRENSRVAGKLRQATAGGKSAHPAAAALRGT